jgi:hypothetical protein
MTPMVKRYIVKLASKSQSRSAASRFRRASCTQRQLTRLSSENLVSASHATKPHRPIEGVVRTQMGVEVTVRWTPGHKGEEIKVVFYMFYLTQ